MHNAVLVLTTIDFRNQKILPEGVGQCCAVSCAVHATPSSRFPSPPLVGPLGWAVLTHFHIWASLPSNISDWLLTVSVKMCQGDLKKL